jgi:hypothetical protein
MSALSVETITMNLPLPKDDLSSVVSIAPYRRARQMLQRYGYRGAKLVVEMRIRGAQARNQAVEYEFWSSVGRILRPVLGEEAASSA